MYKSKFVRLASATARATIRATVAAPAAWLALVIGVALPLEGIAQTSSQSHSAASTSGASQSATPGAAPNIIWQGIGRPATAAELKAWDIDVRADFKGLPKGSGSVAKGQDVWEAKCASCHGVFGESNEVFTPISTGIQKTDMKTGRAAGLIKGEAQRSTLMKVATVSTVWDYINRAMPWNAPKTLSVEEVYAVTAYVLHLGDVLPAEFTLSDRNIAEVQQRMPNRNGMTNKHGMWKVSAKPDVNGTACMSNCGPEVKVASFLPDYAKNAHGNLAEQNRMVGGARGVNTAVAAAGTVEPAGATATAAPAAGAASTGAPKRASEFAGMRELANKNTCLACHGIDRKVVGPGFNEIAAKYKSDSAAAAYLAGKIKLGGQGVWGATPMPPSTVSDAEAQKLAQWILKGTPE